MRVNKVRADESKTNFIQHRAKMKFVSEKVLILRPHLSEIPTIWGGGSGT